jgi:condensin complex subunit 2
MRGQRLPATGRGDEEIDENFWAQAAANQAAGQGNNGDETADGSAIPFNTQFFHDDYDDGPGFDDIDDGGGGVGFVDPEEQDLLTAVNGSTRRVRPQFVNYAKKAKRVDVRKLKENIWKGLKLTVPEENAEEAQVPMVRAYVAHFKTKLSMSSVGDRWVVQRIFYRPF